MALLFVSLWSTLVGQPSDSLVMETVDPFSENLFGLVSLDPQERLRAAWLRPDFTAEGEEFSINGWRFQELRYRMDGISLWDLESGQAAVHLPRTLLASARLVNENANITPVVSLDSRKYDSRWRAQASGLYPFFADSSHTGAASLFFSIPIGAKLCVGFDGEVVKWSERPATERTLPHRGMAGYTGVASAVLVPSPGMLVQVKLLRSTEQRDYFSPQWAFNPSSAPSSFTLVDLLFFNYRYRKGILDLDMTLSSYNSALLYGGRGTGELSPFRNYPSLDTLGVTAVLDVNNLFGVKGLFYSPGAYPQQTLRNALVDRAHIRASVMIGDVHELRGSLDFAGTSIYAEIKSFYNDRENTSTIQQSPRLGEFYLADRMTWKDWGNFEDFWVEPGMGALYLEGDASDSVSGELPLHFALMPRIQSHLLIRGFNLNAEAELAAETPPLGLFYEGQDAEPWTDSLLIIPNLTPCVERAFKFGLEADRRWSERWITGLYGFASLGYKLVESGVSAPQDAGDTVPGAGVFMKGRSQAFGLQPWVRYNLPWIDVSFAYRFWAARSTSKGFEASYLDLIRGEEGEEITTLPLEPRHKFVLKTRLQSPDELPFLVRGWFIVPGIALESGFPDEVNGESAPPWWAWFEIAAGRTLKIGPVSTEIKAEFLNPFGWTGPVIGEIPHTSLPGEEDFPARVYLGDSDYRASRDADHDGVITAAEEVEAYRRASQFLEAVTPSPLPGRSLELKLTVTF